MKVGSEDHVLLAVPIAIAGRVHELAAQFYAEGQPEAEHPSEADEELQSDWPAELIQRAWKESASSMSKLLRHLASKSNEKVHSAELIEVLELGSRDGASGRRALAGTLGAFGRRVRNRYGRDTWPFDAEWDHTRGEMGYRMPTDVADQIRTLAGQKT